jgi:hypothetical protein
MTSTFEPAATLQARGGRQPERKVMIISGTVMVGRSRFIREGERDGYKRYRVEADVLPYFGRLPKPGAVWIHQTGAAPASESWDSIETRNQYPADIYNFRGNESAFPYSTERN